MNSRVVYSFVLDQGPAFAYQGWHLAKSLRSHCEARAQDIHVHCTERVDDEIVELFAGEGYKVHRIEAFLDGKFCNKLSQLPNLINEACDCYVLLDTDTIAVSDLRPFLIGAFIQGKIVDGQNPSLAAFRELYSRAGGTREALVVPTESDDAETFHGNANGGFYCVPAALAQRFSDEWRRWAEWLAANDEPLRREGQANHIDQASVALAVQVSGLPFVAAPSNINYFLHFKGQHRYLDRRRPIALLHYHSRGMNILGRIEAPFELDAEETAAVSEANRMIGGGDEAQPRRYRYGVHPDSGFGFASLDDYAAYIGRLLTGQGLEGVATALELSWGEYNQTSDPVEQDLITVDVSLDPATAEQAGGPEARYAVPRARAAERRDVVLCFDALIAAPTRESYDAMVRIVAAGAGKTLLAAGYEWDCPLPPGRRFYEPLSTSLARTGRFANIRAIGAVGDVVIFRCDVEQGWRSSSSSSLGAVRPFLEGVSQ